MGAIRYNRQAIAFLATFFVCMYTIFGLLYTKTGNDFLDEYFTLEDMPDQGISAGHIEEALRNEVVTSSVSSMNLEKNMAHDFMEDYDELVYAQDVPTHEKPSVKRSSGQSSSSSKKKSHSPPKINPYENFKPDHHRLKEKFLKSKAYKKEKKSLDKVEKRFTERLDHLHSFCKTYGELPDLSINSINGASENQIKAQHRSVLYMMGNHGAVCAPYKSANTLFAELSCYLSGNQVCNAGILHQKYKGSPRKWANLKKEHVDPKHLVHVGRHNLILSTRHPIERVLATWYTTFKRETPLSKLTHMKTKKAALHKQWHQKFSPFMMMYNRTIRHTLNEPKITNLGDETHWITFSQFVDWITAKHQGNHNMILPQFEFCDICKRKYKYITKTRTLKDDMDYIFKMTDINEDYAKSNPKHPLNADLNHTPSHHAAGLEVSRSEKHIQAHVKKYLKMLTKKQVKKLAEKYRIDMQAFGYSFDVRLLQIGGLTD